MGSNALGEVVGTVWDAKSDDRAVRVESAQFSLGEEHLQIINLETRRTSRITLTGLRRKFTQRLDL
jgi:hypothetical protein